MPENGVRLETVMPRIMAQLEQGGKVQLSFQGTSMLPMLLGGRDQVILSPVTGPLRKYDLPLYQRANGQYVLHRIVKAGDSYTCVGDNQFLLEPGVQQAQLLAVVSGFIRKGKAYSTQDLSYRIYCRYWHWSRPLRRLYRGGIAHLRRVFSGK